MDARFGAPARDLLAWAADLRHKATSLPAAMAVLDSATKDAVERLGRETRTRDGLAAATGGVERFDLTADSHGTADVVAAFRRRERVRAANDEANRLAGRVMEDLARLEGQAKSGRGRLRMRMAGSTKRQEVQAALEHLEAYRKWADEHGVGGFFEHAVDVVREPSPVDRAELWSDVGRRPQWYADRITAFRGAGALVVPSSDVLRAAQLGRQLPAVAEATERAKERVKARFDAVRQAMIRADLVRMPVNRVKDVTGGRLRLGVLEKSGFSTIQSILDATPGRLMQLDGVGEQTAKQVYAAARQIAKAAEEDLRFRINLDPSDQMVTALVQALYGWDRLHQLTLGLDDEELGRIAGRLTVLKRAHPPDGGISVVVDSPDGRALVEAVSEGLSWATQSGGWSRLDNVEAVLSAEDVAADRAWADFAQRAADYYTLLGTLVDLNLDEEAESGYLPADIVQKVHAQPLDGAFAKVSLRGYQSFGARFALVQKRVIIGDEMGLGKTIQAIAVLAHLKSTAAKGRLIVVCPASVLVNWTREVAQRSSLRVHRIHGPERDWALKRWLKFGDVAVTTFETLRALDLRGVDFAMVVVDEAHFMKNPATQRSRNVLRLLARSDRALFLTGTPMENRVDEFRTLVSFLQPWLVDGWDAKTYVAPERFRQRVAPAYLRRNQEDVLAELPELVITDEWEELTAADLVAYRAAVADRNFMAMRRAAFSHPDQSAKLARLREIVAEAGENGHKTIVFSYFRDVLDKVGDALNGRAFGPLTGGVAPTRRQELVDRFAAAKGGAVLLSQIQAGGVGLNMQAGSVVIICEPQVKPTLEAQAIARAHRMGQVRGVQVHRLLTVDSVDQRMVEMLDSKQQLFEEYARRSELANASPEALDISEASLAKAIIEQEQKRLAMDAAARFSVESSQL